MATVDGITVAKADQIDKKHIASMSVVGTDLRLTRENGTTLQTPLPGGFTPKWQLFTPGDLTTGRTFHSEGIINLNTSSLLPDDWNAYSLSGSGSTIEPIDFQSTPGEFGWAYGEAGWYMLQFQILATFVANSVDPTVLPDALKVDFTTWQGVSVNQAFPLVERHTNIGGTKRDVHGSLSVGPYYSPGFAVELNEKDAHQLFLRWNGNAVIGHPNGGTDPSIEMKIAKIA